jgi:hypothetical protein
VRDAEVIPMKCNYDRSHSGQATLEMVASLVWLLPIMVTVVWAIMEASQAYYITNFLSVGANQAARGLALAYGQNPAVATNPSMQSSVFDNIRISNIINSSSQFEAPVFNTLVTPSTVSITANYLGGQYGLPTFPTFDPFNLGSAFQLKASSTYALE